MGRAAPELIYHPIYSELELPYRHRYPIGKYRALYQALQQLGVPAHAFQLSETADLALIRQIHQPDYLQALCTGQLDAKAMRRIGFPWSEQLIRRSLLSVGGTVQSTRLALQHGLALHLSGGYHHAFADYGSGFCLLNDLAVAARYALNQGVHKVLIFDCDVHQGDGTAAIFANEPAVITCSLHGEKNFPYHKQHSDWDLALDSNSADPDYLAAVEQSLDYLLRLHQPELVIYDAGIDVHQQDELGLLAVSTRGIAQRDWLVLSRCQQEGIPVAAVIGGGYQRDLAQLTHSHLQLFFAAFALAGQPLPSHPDWQWALAATPLLA
ncbi:histone deacetylase [Rheinheimera sp.]|uniref:histone deacetylase family protein n=1 Tax=Rheinheimera sp. TaxID=1869214 RepID=UPI00307F9F80